MARISSRRIGVAWTVLILSACAPIAKTTTVPPPIVLPPPATQTCPDSSVVPATATCPVPAPAPAPLPMGPFNIFFDWGKAEISTDAAATLDNAAAAFAQTGTGTVSLAAFSDKSGSARANAVVAERRAEAAKAYLIGRGVPEGAITTTVSGESSSLIPTADGVREAQNRRVEITIAPGPAR